MTVGGALALLTVLTLGLISVWLLGRSWWSLRSRSDSNDRPRR